MDDSTRSTDRMLGEEEDESVFGLPLSVTLSTLQKKNSKKKGEGDAPEDSLSSSSSKPSRASFEHLIPKQHHDKRTRLHRQQNELSSSLHSNQESVSHSEHGLSSHPHSFNVTSSSNGKLRYQLWEGKNKFLCGGRFMMGVHSKHLMLTTILLLGTNGLFLFLLVPLLDRPVLFHVGAIIAILNLLFLFLTAFTEPGIIPRRPPSKLLENMSADAREKMQYCHTCRIVRPPRAKHCRYCDNCVEVFDHHW